MIFDEWIEQAYALGASDLHLEADTPVVVRVRGELQTIGGAVAGGTLLQVGQDLLGAERWAQFKERGSADLSDIGRAEYAAARISFRRCAALRPRSGSWRRSSRICARAICMRIFASSSKPRAGSSSFPGRPDPGNRRPLPRSSKRSMRPRPQYRHAGKSGRIPIRQSPILHPAARDSLALAELRAGHHRCVARESGRAGHQRDAHARGHAADAECRRDRASGAGHHAFGKLRGSAEPHLHVISL